MAAPDPAEVRSLAARAGELWGVMVQVDRNHPNLAFDASVAEKASLIRHTINAKAVELGLPKALAYVGTPMHECNKAFSVGHDLVPNHFVFLDTGMLMSQGQPQAERLLGLVSDDVKAIMAAKTAPLPSHAEAESGRKDPGYEPSR